MIRREPAILFAGDPGDREQVDLDDLLYTRPPPPGQTAPLRARAVGEAARLGVSTRAALVYLGVQSSTGYRTRDGIGRATGLGAFAVEVGLSECLRAGAIGPATRAGRAVTGWRRCR